MLMLKKDDNLLDNFEAYIDKKLALKGPNMEAADIDLVDESLNTKSHAKVLLSGCTPQNRLFESELSSSLKEIRFSK